MNQIKRLFAHYDNQVIIQGFPRCIVMHLVILLWIFNPILILGQPKIEVGTQWTYSFNDFGLQTPTTISVVSDTTINNTTWYELSDIGGCAENYNNLFLREEGSKVYYLDLNDNNEYLLYDYNKKSGEFWEIKIPGIESYYKINVDSVGLLDIDGSIMKVQFIDNIDLGSYIIEGIGSESYLFPQRNICDPQFRKIRCYENQNLFIDFDQNFQCEDVYLFTSISESTPTGQIEIIPNPSKGFFIVKGINQNTKYNIYDMCGNLILKGVYNGKEISFQKSGLFIIMFENNLTSRIISN